MTNIDDLLNKVENEGMTPEGRLSSSEFNRLVQAVKENQGSVKSVKMGGLEPVYPDANGMVTIQALSTDWTDVFRVQRKVTRNYEEVWETVTDGSEYLYRDVDVPLRILFQEYRQQEIDGEVVTDASNVPLTIRVLKQTATGEVEVGRITDYRSQPYENASWREVNLSSMLSSGDNSIAIEVSGGLKGETPRRAFTVIAANLSIAVSDDHNWATRAFVLGSADRITVEYYAAGSADRTLCVTFTGASGTSAVFRQSIPASASSSTATGIMYTQSEDTVGFFSEGIRTVTAWLEATVGDDTVTSDTVTSHIIVVESGSQNSYVAIQDCIASMLNYESATMFRYNIYAPESPASVTFQLADANRQTVYLEVPIEGRATNMLYDFTNVLSIQSQYQNVRVYIYAKVNGTYVNNGSSLSDFLVDNSEDYGAVEGADFFLNPALRNNQESNPSRIINAMTGEEVTGSVFTNVSFRDGVDGWMEVGNRRVLRMLAGSSLVIPYDVYSEFTDNSNHGLTIEIDTSHNNITDEESPQITIGNRDASNPKGLYLKSLNGAMVTKSNNSWDSVDLSWQEGVRTHKAFTYQHNYVLNNPEPGRGHSQTARLAIEKVYIRGCAEKTYRVTNTGDPTEVNAGGDIVITPTGCDIDIYGIRVYKRALTAEQVKKNHRSTLNTTAEKKADFDANDIMIDGRISLAKCLAAGYDCIVRHGKHISRQFPNNPKRCGKIDFYRHYADGTLDRAHTGTLYGCEDSGQGTTAMTYADWNVGTKEDKGTGEGHDEWKYNDNGTLRSVFVDIDGNVGFGKTKFGYQMDDGDPVAKKLVGKINFASSMQSHKEGACNMYNDLCRICVAQDGSSYSYDRTKCITDFSRGQRVTVKERPFFYFVQEEEGADDALAVFKGLMTFGPGKADKPTWGVTDESLLDGDSLIEGALNNNPLTDMRVPFVDTVNPVTGRYVNEYQIKDDQNNKVESFVYAGGKNLNWGFGDTLEMHDNNSVVWDGVREADKTNADAPTTKQVKMWQPIYNFLYLTNTRFQPWSGTLRELNIAVQSPSFDSAVSYWMTQDGDGYSKFDLYRCHYESGGTRLYVPSGIQLRRGGLTYTNFAALYDISAVPTGLTEYTTDDLWYDVSNPATATRDIAFNLRTELNSMIAKYGIGSAINYNDDALVVNTAMRKMMCRVFRLFVENNIYLHKKSNVFHHEMMVLWAGTDNRSKNTYNRLNPYAVQTVNGVSHNWPNMECNDDDLDTILKTNNVGIQSKPYYALETDTDPVLGTKYWQGQDNVLNNSLQDAYGYGYLETEEINLTLSNMMGSIFAAMTTLATGKTMPDGTLVEASPIGCFDYYFFTVQRYFPATAYNETGRIRYEIPSMLFWNQTAPEGAEGEDYPEDPMNQSLGDQYDSEKDYVRRRITMLAGYAGYRMNQFGFRGYAGVFSLTLKPHQYLYPMYEVGDQQSSSPRRSMQRVAPGESYVMTFNNPSATNGVYVFFIGSMKEIGNIGPWSNGSYSDEASATALAPSGTRLVLFEMWSEIPEGVVFNPRSGTFDLGACRNIEQINVLNAYRLRGLLGLTNLVRLRSIDARGTAITSLTLPETPLFTELKLPSGYKTLEARNCPNLETITIGDYTGLTSVVLSNVGFDSQALIEGAWGYNKELDENVLQTVTLTGINWSNCSSAMLRWLLTVENLTLTGRIHMSASPATGQVNFALKKALIDKFGDVDSESNPLYIDYTPSTLGGVTVTGDGYFDAEDEEKYYDLVPNVITGNTIRSYQWSITGASGTFDPNEYIEITDPRGWFRCKKMGTEAQAPTMYIQCVVTLVDGTTLPAATATIRCYFRQAHIGDYVYHDGTWDNRLNVAKTVVGICFYCKQIYENGQPTGRYDRRMVQLGGGTSRDWGLYPAGSAMNANGFQSSGEGALTYTNSQGLEVAPFDVPNLDNITTAGASFTTYDNMIDANNPSPEYDENDNQKFFKVYANNTALGRLNLVELSETLKTAVFPNDDMYDNDTMVPQGLHDTAALIAHRNNVLAGTSHDPDPTTEGEEGETNYSVFKPNDTYPSDLAQKILDIRQFATDTLEAPYPNIYSQYLYAAASQAFSYQPTVAAGQTLNEKFTAGHWYLPSVGELARLCFFAMVCYSGSTLYNASAYEMFGDIFANAAAAGLFTRFSALYYWSSSEYNSTNAWSVSFSSGSVSSSTSKYSSFVARAVAAF